MATQHKPPQDFHPDPCPDIPLTPVTSKQVKAIGYCPTTKRLRVQFVHGGGHDYVYPGVTADQHQALLKAESIGNHFNTHIKHLKFDKHRAPEKAPA